MLVKNVYPWIIIFVGGDHINIFVVGKNVLILLLSHFIDCRYTYCFSRELHSLKRQHCSDLPVGVFGPSPFGQYFWTRVFSAQKDI